MRIIQKDGDFNVILPKNMVNNNIKLHKLALKSQMSNFTYTIGNLVDEYSNRQDYYRFVINFSQLPIPNGEYIYTVDDSDACGLLILGDVKSTVESVEYKTNQKYIIYGDE